MKEIAQEIPQTSQSANQGAQPRTRTHQHYSERANGTGAKVLFALGHTPRDVTQLAVYVGGLRMRPKSRAVANDYSLFENRVTFVVAPAAGVDNVCFDIVAP